MDAEWLGSPDDIDINTGIHRKNDVNSASRLSCLSHGLPHLLPQGTLAQSQPKARLTSDNCVDALIQE